MSKIPPPPKFCVTRNMPNVQIDKKELQAGTIVIAFQGATWGCVGPEELACVLDGHDPYKSMFFTVAKEALEEITAHIETAERSKRLLDTFEELVTLVTLETASGELVTISKIPTFNKQPDVLLFGARIFIFDRMDMQANQLHYKEAFAFAVFPE